MVRELFAHADDWKETRSRVDTLLIADLQLKNYTDDELREYFAKLREWNIQLELEVGAVKPWGKTGERTFTLECPHWDRVGRLGGVIASVCMDEPFVAARKQMNQTDAFALDETVAFIEIARRNFPDLLIGDIEPYPAIPLADHFEWIEKLNKRLAERHVRGLDFYRLDVDWANYTVRTLGSWQEVKKLEHFCRQRRLPFGLIYWAAGYPALAKRGLADDSTWYVSLMQQGYDYALIDGRPDQTVIQSWIGAPLRMTPETDEFTFTRSCATSCANS